MRRLCTAKFSVPAHAPVDCFVNIVFVSVSRLVRRTELPVLKSQFVWSGNIVGFGSKNEFSHLLSSS